MEKELKRILNSKTFCILPWISMQVATNGDIRLCCKSNSDKFTLENINNINLDEKNNCKKIVDIRKKIICGQKLEHCQKCYNVEKNGGLSLRQANLEDRLKSYANALDFDSPSKLIKEIVRQDGYWEYLPIHLDIKPGNICNLNCRMCGPASSNQIHRGGKKTATLEWMRDKKNFHKIKKIVKKINYLKIGGGEPILMSSVVKLLDYCLDNNISKNINLQITTNGLNINILDKYIGKFKSFRLVFSIDAIEHVYEHIRRGSSWKVLEDNFISALSKKELEPCVNTVVMMTSAYYLSHNLIPWFNKMSKIRQFDVETIFLEEPNYYSPFLLPLSSRMYIAKNIEDALNESNYLNDKTKNNFLIISNKLQEPGFSEEKIAQGFRGFIRECRN